MPGKRYSVCVGLCLLLVAASLAGYAQTDSLSKFRPRYVPPKRVPDTTGRTSVKPVHQINSQLQQVMDSIAEYNLKITHAEGFRLSVYTGNDRETAMRLRDKLYSLYPDLRVYLSYKLPTFKLKAGDYFNKFDAQRALEKLKTEFPDALIVQDEISVR